MKKWINANIPTLKNTEFAIFPAFLALKNTEKLIFTQKVNKFLAFKALFLDFCMLLCLLEEET